MDFIQHSTSFRHLVFFLIITLYVGASKAASLQRPATCNRQNTFFKQRHIYTYDYTVIVSSAFLGASPSKSGSKLVCTVTLAVPRRCEHLLQISDCRLSERSQGADNTYTDVQSADQFLQDLQRYPLYFQMNEGLIIADSIVADDRDTLQVLNMKKGILSALQFPNLEKEEYKNPANTTDIFGRCAVEYEVLDGATDEMQVTSTRNLKYCDLPNVYTKQVNVIPGPSVGQMVGGVIEEPITEMLYPFEMPVSCLYTVRDDQTLGDVDCIQKQYFKPLAYKGDYLVAAMTNVSQKLGLQEMKKKKIPRPDLSLDGKSIVDIKFDFGDDFNPESTLTVLDVSLKALTEQFVKSGDVDGYESVPGMFGELVELFRAAPQDVLDDLKMEVFDCGEECEDNKKETAQLFFLDGLESCGTEACIQVFLDCMLHDHTTTVQTATFLQGLRDIHHVSEDVLVKLFEYCEKNEETLCWLTLGTILSKSSPEDIKEGTVLYQVLDLIQSTIDANCNSATVVDTERKLNTVIKMGKNIGHKLLMHFRKAMPNFKPMLKICLQTGVIPTSVKISFLQMIEDSLVKMHYKDIPQPVVDALFVVVKDATMDTTLRDFSFSLLMKTTNKETIKEVKHFMMGKYNTGQMRAYMTSAVRTLLQNDAPDLQEVRESWEAVREEEHFNPRFHELDSFSRTMSKSIASGYFFKIPISEIFGGQIEADLMYNPPSMVFSTLKTAVNYYYGEEKHQLFEFMIRTQGFDLLIDVLLKRIDMTLEEMYELYQNLKARAQGQRQGDEQLAKFQQNIVKAVEDILNEVNHPVELDFDLNIDVSIKGKEVMFWSLKEWMTAMRQMKSKLPPKTSMAQIYLKKLLQGISQTTLKSKEMVGLIRDLPTCAGLPLNLTVHAYGTYMMENSLQSNLLLFMAKKSPTVSASLIPGITFVHELQGELAVQFCPSHTSGMKAKILFGGERDLSYKLTYRYSDPMTLVENPSKKKVEIEMKGIYENDDRTLQRVIYARGRMQLNHYSGLETIPTDSSVEGAYKQCNVDQWISMLARKKMCLDFRYPDVTTSETHAYFPLSGPFDLDVTIEDLEIVDVYKLVFEYEIQKIPGAGYSKHFNITHVGIDDKMTETEYGHMNFVYVKDDRSLIVDAALKDFNYTYNANFTFTQHSSLTDFVIAELIKHNGLAFSGYFFKVLSKRHGHLDEGEFRWNITSPRIGWDISVHIMSEGRYRDIQFRNIDLSLTYYCSKDNPLLYMFHLIPTWASENSDTTKFHVKYSVIPSEEKDNKNITNGMIEFYGRKVAWEGFLIEEGPTLHAHKVLTYSAGGVEKTATVEMSRTWRISETRSTLDLSGNIEGDNYNVVATGSYSLGKTNVIVTGDIEYDNKEEENSLTGKKLSTVNKVNNVKKDTYSSSETDIVIIRDGEKSKEGGMIVLLQDSDYPEHSIWDLKKWNAKVGLSARLNPIFADGVTPGKAPPEGVEATGTLTVEHPWNGGYVKHTEVFTAGKNIQSKFSNFRFWLSGEMNTAFTTLDDTPVMDGDKPLVITRRLESHVYRHEGKIFDFVFNYHGPHLQKKYTILFDWEASTHHDPLYHVMSEQTSDSMPFLNHHYDEKLYYDHGHILHNMNFTSKALEFNSEMEYIQHAEVYLQESGRISILYMGKVLSFEFLNKGTEDGLEFAIKPGSIPDTLVYTMEIVDIRTFRISGAIKKQLEVDPSPLWSTQVSLKGSTMIEVTQSWTPAYDEHMGIALRQGMMQRATMFQAAGNQLRVNSDKQLADQTFPFTSVTPGDMIKQTVMPTCIGGMKFWGRFLGNIVPSQYQPDKQDVPGPVIAPRFTILMQAMKKSQNSGPNPWVRRIQYLDYLGFKAIGNLLFAVSTSRTHAQKIEEIIAQRQYSYVITTSPYTFERLFEFPKLTEFHEHANHQLRVMFGFFQSYYYKKQFQQESLKSVASIFGRHDSNRVLNIHTFDGSFFELAADQTEECSYLLASDLRQRRWSLVLSPAGVTLLTSNKTVTVGWDKNVYIDNCKLPSSENSDESLIVEKTDEAIHVITHFGLTLECDTTYDNCLVSLEGPYRNETIGLLGTNDKEKSSDFRLKSGTLTSDRNQFVENYELTGFQVCRAQAAETSRKQKPADKSCWDVKKACTDMFGNYYTPLYKCSNSDGTFKYHQYCENEAERCKDGVNSCHAVKAYIDVCDRKGLLDNPEPLQGLCMVDSATLKSSVTGSLDIAFVVSQHVSMTEKRDQATDYMYELAVSSDWDQFKEVRLGVVLFGGNNAAPYAVRLEDNDNGLFTNNDDFDWEGLSEVSQQTDGGIADAEAFLAIQEAAAFPFNPVAHKQIIVLMTKEQSSGKAPDISALKADLQEKGITLNIISTYSKTSSSRIVGINWDGQIMQQSGYRGNRSLPKNDYVELLTATKGALWDLNVLSERQDSKITRIVEEIVSQTQQNDQQFCPAA